MPHSAQSCMGKTAYKVKKEKNLELEKRNNYTLRNNQLKILDYTTP